MTILVFGEGSTEEKVCKKMFTLLGYHKDYATYIPAEGKDKLNNTVMNRIRPLLEEKEPVDCVILRDLDSHTDETEARICQSISGALQRELNRIDIQITMPQLTTHSTQSNVYTLSLPDLNFRLALHIAIRRWNNSFIKSTIDDYVLELALRENTVNRLAEQIRITPNNLAAKITDEMPDLLARNGITLVEAKDYVRIYAAITKLHTSPPVFAEKIMANADEADICEIFQPLLAAFEFVGSE